MISVDNVSVNFGGFVLFDRISMQVSNRERIGLVGRNGAGKTTLLRIIAGIQEPVEGKVVRPGDLTIGYLPQQMMHMDGKTVYQEAMTAFREILDIENRIEEVNREIQERTDFHSDSYTKLIEKLSNLTERYELEGGNSLHADVERTLTGLGFEQPDLKRPTSEFSGGWRMRIELAKILLRKPDFILLDEPTNHLDIESIQWLEDYLSSYHGSVILISHDRAFLDRVTNRTVEISLGRLIDYRVPYSRFKILREERRVQEKAAYTNQQKMIRDTEEFIERFRYKATKAVQVQSRIKQLDKLERIEIEDEDNSVMNIKFPPAPRSGRVVIKAESLSKSYGAHRVLQTIDLVIERGERVAFVGKNGEGKTTLSKIIAGEVDYEGELVTGHNVNLGYFAQDQDELLDENKTVFEIIDAVAVGDIRTKMRDILGAFLFSGEDVDKKVKVLSGGERSRLSLARMLLQAHNLLLMDEPTNHLDMRSKDILKNALLSYDGTLIVVSHDRDFLDGLVEKVYEFRNRKIKEYSGGIYNFLEKKNLRNLKELDKKVQGVQDTRQHAKGSDNKNYRLEKKEYEKRLRKAKQTVSDLEERIAVLESELNTLAAEMEKGSPEPGAAVYDDYEKIRKELDDRLIQWEKAHMDLQELEEQSF